MRSAHGSVAGARVRLLLTAVFATLVPAGHSRPAAPARDAPLVFQKPRFTREQIEAGFAAGTERWWIIYGSHDPELAPVLRERALLVARRLFGGDTAAVVADHDLAARVAGERSLVLLGGPETNDWTARLAAALPVQFTHGGFRWHDRDYARPGDVVHLVHPHPLDPKRMVVLIAGNSAAAMTRRGGGFFLGGEDWRIYRDGELVRSGSFAQSAAQPWRYDRALDRDREQERDRFTAGLRRQMGRGVVVASAANSALATRAMVRAEEVVRRLEARGWMAVESTTGSRRGTPPAAAATPRTPRPPKPIDVVLYSSLEEKARFTRISRAEHVDESSIAQVALPAGHEMPDAWSVAGAWLGRAGASLDSRFFVPASVWLGGRYGGESLDRAVRRVYRGRLLPSAREAATTDTLWRSPLIWIPARVLLCASIMDCAGMRARAAMMKLVERDPPANLDALCRTVGVDARRVEQRYLVLADSLARRGEHEPPAHPAPRPWRAADGFQRGVCFAHAVSLEGGYLSAAAGRELLSLKRMGANWISLTPFGYLPGRDVPVIHPSAQGGPEEETDESVCEASARARAAGLRVLLKPHLWTRGWVGELDFGLSGWPRFFAQYRRFITHYALLADREGMDGFVVGHELPTASLAFPDRWRALIGDVRRVYPGMVTYGANWDREARELGFWDALDLVGVSFYYPLAEQPTRDVSALAAGAKRALAGLRAIAARTGKPVVLLEAGYPALTSAPVRPWEEQPGRADLETQRACYEALVKALEPEDWVAGAFFWKWFSSDDGRGPADPSFTPRGKPAQAVMTRAFGTWQGRPVRVLKP